MVIAYLAIALKLKLKLKLYILHTNLNRSQICNVQSPIAIVLNFNLNIGIINNIIENPEYN